MKAKFKLIVSKRTSENSYQFSKMILAGDYSFLQYQELITSIILEKCQWIKQKEMGMLYNLHGQKAGFFTHDDIYSYPLGYKRIRAAKFILDGMENGAIRVYKKHSRFNPDIFVFTDEFNKFMDDMYQYLFLIKKISTNESCIGALRENMDVIALCERQNVDVDNMREEYTVYKAVRY